MLLSGCVLLAGSRRVVYRGACQLLPLGCCSMWKQWGESPFDAFPTWFSLSALLFSCFLFDGALWSVCQRQEADESTPTQENSHGPYGLKLAARISGHTCAARTLFFLFSESVKTESTWVCRVSVSQGTRRMMTLNVFLQNIHMKVSGPWAACMRCQHGCRLMQHHKLQSVRWGEQPGDVEQLFHYEIYLCKGCS